MTWSARSDATHWDRVAADYGLHDPTQTWRAYMQAVYRDLMQRWLVPAAHSTVTGGGVTLKTDLFEEAVTPYHLFDELGPEGIGVDLSSAVVRAAAQRTTKSGAAPRVLVADLRQLPFATASLHRVLSGSSLDHFERKADIAIALGELARCLHPKGCLVVTFDNPHNPVVWLRNRLPLRTLSMIGLVPYFVGATYTRHDIAREFAALGLRVTALSAVAHVPRAPAIWLAIFCERLGQRTVLPWLRRAFRLWDVLEASPLRFRTGYYLAVRAEKIGV